MTCRPNTLQIVGLPADEGRVSGQISCVGIEVTIITPHTRFSIARGKTRDIWAGLPKELQNTGTSFLTPTYVIRECSGSVLCAPAWSARLLGTRFLSHCKLLSETTAKKPGFLLSGDSLLLEQRGMQHDSQQITWPALRQVGAAKAGGGSPKKTA